MSIPCFSLLSKYKYLIGLKLYDLLAGKRSVGKSHFINKEETSLRLKTLSSDKVFNLDSDQKFLVA